MAKATFGAVCSKRKNTSHKLRFEVFKRDKFTCQYCGHKAPDVVLNADHIEPVAEGGTTDILNLITSCFSCNSGKSDRKLSDQSALQKQRAQLEELEERRQQIEAMLEWRKGLSHISRSATDAAVQVWQEHTPGWHTTDTGRKHFSQWVKKFGLDFLLRAIEEVADLYIHVADGKAAPDSVEDAFNRIPKFCGLLAQEAADPHIRDYVYIQAIVRNINNRPHHKCVDVIRAAHVGGMSIEDIKAAAKSCYSVSGFEKSLAPWSGL